MVKLLPRLEKRYKKAQSDRKKKNGLTAEQYQAEKRKIFDAQKKHDERIQRLREEREAERTFIKQLLKDLAKEEKAKRDEERKKKREEKKRKLRYPVLEGVTLTSANFDTVKFGAIAKWIKNIPQKLFTIRVLYGDNQEKVIHKNDTQNNETWWDSGHYWKLMASSDETIFDQHGVVTTVARMELLRHVPVTGNPGIQHLRDGERHCIFGELRDFFAYKLTTASPRKQKSLAYCVRKCDVFAEKYDAGITIEDLEKEIKCLQLTVAIYRMDRSVKCILNPNGDYRYNFINNRFNHCETLFSDTATEQLSLLDMNQKMEELIENNTEFRYEQGNTFIKRIMADKCYALKMPYDDAFKAFNDSIERQYFNIDYMKEKDLFEYIQQAGNQNTHMRFRDAGKGTKLHEVDCKAGYTQFKKAPVYKGFLGCVWDFCSNVGIEDVRKNIGIYTVRVTSVHPRYVKHFKVGERYTLTSPMIEFLTGVLVCSKGFVQRVSFDVEYGIYGSKFDMEFPESFLDKCDMKTGKLYTKGEAIPKDADAKPLYSLWVGATASVSTHRKICSKVDYKLVQEYNNDGIPMDWVYADECYKNENINGTWVRTLLEQAETMESPPGYGVQYLEKEASVNCPQIFAFVTDYMRQNMLYEMEQIAEEDIYSWKVDSIVYKGNYTFRSIFRPKKVKNDFLMSSHIFKSVSPLRIEKTGIILSGTIFTGAGGSGKSEFASKMRKTMYVAPMWSMNASFHNKYHVYATTPQRVFGIDCRSIFETSGYRPATLYFDEATMIDNATKQQALGLNKHIRVIFGGDFDDKGRPFQTVFQTCMNLDGLIQKPFLHDYRSAIGDPIRELKTDIRAFMYEQYGDSQKLVEYVKSLLPNNIVTKADVVERYTVNDWVLASTVKNRDAWTQMLQHKGEKYYVTKHSEMDIGKAFRGENIALKGDIIYEDNKRCEVRHGFTIHSAQGKTITENIYIDIDNMDFDYCLLYTAISRAKRLEQIFLVV